MASGLHDFGTIRCRVTTRRRTSPCSLATLGHELMARSTTAGLIVAPLAAPAIIGSLIALSFVWTGEVLDAFTVLMVYGGIFYATLISYAVMLLAFLPLALRFARRGWNRA